MRTTRFMHYLCCFLCVFAIAISGCKDDETTNPPAPTGFASNSPSLSAAPGGNANATLSGGTAPYSIQTTTDTTIARVSISGSTLTMTAVGSGYTSVVIKDAANATLRIGLNVTGPITYTIFPLIAGHRYIYGGYAINTSSNGSTRLPDPLNLYNTSWTLLGPNPGPFPPAGSYVIVDTTTVVFGPTAVPGTRTLVIIRNPATGSFTFLQTLGPFFRALGVLPLGRTDTVRAVMIADPSLGVGGTWTAFDSSYTNATGATVRLQILGSLEAGETITDSSDHDSPLHHETYDALRFRTYRNVFVGSSQVVSNATTSRLWLVKNVGPVQVHIAEDTENLGHFRVLKDKNF